MGRAGVDRCRALVLERLDRLHQRAGGVDLVIDDHRGLARHLADDVHHLGLVLVAHDTPLLDDREGRAQDLGEVAGPLGEAELADDDEVIELLRPDLGADDVDRGQLVHGDEKKPWIWP